jgi:hypothetical protein
VVPSAAGEHTRVNFRSVWRQQRFTVMIRNMTMMLKCSPFSADIKSNGS